jgi:hypothetical protein
MDDSNERKIVRLGKHGTTGFPHGFAEKVEQVNSRAGDPKIWSG